MSLGLKYWICLASSYTCFTYNSKKWNGLAGGTLPNNNRLHNLKCIDGVVKACMERDPILLWYCMI